MKNWFEMKHFFILGNGGSGTSLLRGLLNAHPEIHCQFEVWCSDKTIETCLKEWLQTAKECEKENLIYGNKIPFEQFKTHKTDDNDMIRIADHFKIIWMQRRYSKYAKKKNSGTFKQSWDSAREIYWVIREKYPDRIIKVSFEDLVLRPYDELCRICGFLNVEYDAQMIYGTRETGHPNYRHSDIMSSKA